MNTAKDVESFLCPPVRQRIDELLGDFYGGCIDKHTFSEIGIGLAEVLECDGTVPEAAMLVVRRHGFGPFDRGVAYRLAVEAINITRGRSGMGYV